MVSDDAARSLPALASEAAGLRAIRCFSSRSIRMASSSREDGAAISPFRTDPYVDSLFGSGVLEVNMPGRQLRLVGREGSINSLSEPSERLAESWSMAYLQDRFDF